jgi:hypothetical protein
MAGEKPDLSRIVDQLRTVHFTLAVTCLALIVATEFSTQGTVRRAHQDLIGIQDALRSVPVGWIDDVARSVYEQDLAPRGKGQGLPGRIHMALTAPETTPWPRSSHSNSTGCFPETTAPSNLPRRSHPNQPRRWVRGVGKTNPSRMKSTEAQPSGAEDSQSKWDRQYSDRSLVSVSSLKHGTSWVSPM